MRTWLKLIGSANQPITEHPFNGDYHEENIGFRKPGKPSICTGDRVFLYAPGGSKRIFALTEAVNDPQRKKVGDCQWTLQVKHLINFPVASGILIDEVNSRRPNLIKSIQQASHIELYPEEIESIFGKLARNHIPVCVDLPLTPDLPDRVATTISRILRDSLLVSTLKKRYNFSCQICKTRLELANGFFYCEAHHIRPLGAPHHGPDEESNLVIVCPNHHVLLDYGAIPFSEGTLTLSSHRIDQAHLDYHNATIHKHSP